MCLSSCRHGPKSGINKPIRIWNKRVRLYLYIYLYYCCDWYLYGYIAHSFNHYTMRTPPQTFHHHHHHVALVARISLTLSHHSSLSFIALGRSSGQHPVSSHSCCMYARAGRPAFVRPYERVHRSTSLMTSSLLLQQCPAYLGRLAWIVFVMGGRWPYSWCFVGCCLYNLFNIARSIFV